MNGDMHYPVKVETSFYRAGDKPFATLDIFDDKGGKFTLFLRREEVSQNFLSMLVEAATDVSQQL